MRKKYNIQKLNLFSKRDISGTAWINHWLRIVCTRFHCNNDNFRMFEARESETEIEQHVIEVYDIHLRLKNWRIMGVKVPCRWRIQVSSNLEQEAMSWVIHKNLVELEITYIRDYLQQVVFAVFKNNWWPWLSFETQCSNPGGGRGWVNIDCLLRRGIAGRESEKLKNGWGYGADAALLKRVAGTFPI